jgi:hypothetical protein
MNMQHIINKNLIKHLSFPDYFVTNWEFILEKKILKIDIEAAWLDIDSGIPLGPGFLLLRDWKNLTIRKLEPHIQEWYTLDYSNFEVLEDICEFKEENSIFYISGFGKTSGWWVEWQVESPKIMAQFYDLKPYALNILLDKYAANEERTGAAISLHRFEDLEVVQALAQVASDPTENIVLIKYSADSLGKIFSKGNLYDQKLIDQLTPRARKIVNDIIRDKNPSLLK